MAPTLSLSVSETDITRPLIDGSVSPQGLEWTVVPEYSPRRHRRFFREGDFDVCEVSLASYVAAMADDEPGFSAVPAFPSKRFRHSYVFTHADADLTDLGDLAGKRVGVQSWQTTAAVWVRGIASEHHDVDLESVTWFRRREDDVPVPVPDRFDVRPVPGEQGADAVDEPRDLAAMLLAGDLDAAIDPANSLFRRVVASDRATLLYDEPLEAERAYYERTGIHPPMHTVAIRDDVLDRDLDVARRVYEAFSAAREQCLEALPGSQMALTWAHLHQVDQEAVLGSQPLEYGLTDTTRHELATFLGYAHDQGLVPRRDAVEDLFVDDAGEFDAS